MSIAVDERAASERKDNRFTVHLLPTWTRVQVCQKGTGQLSGRTCPDNVEGCFQYGTNSPGLRPGKSELVAGKWVVSSDLHLTETRSALLLNMPPRLTTQAGKACFKLPSTIALLARHRPGQPVTPVLLLPFYAV